MSEVIIDAYSLFQSGVIDKAECRRLLGLAVDTLPVETGLAKGTGKGVGACLIASSFNANADAIVTSGGSV